MLSSSHPKIHEPLATGVSPRLTDRPQRQKLRNTRAPRQVRRASWIRAFTGVGGTGWTRAYRWSSSTSAG